MVNRVCSSFPKGAKQARSYIYAPKFEKKVGLTFYAFVRPSV